MDFTHRSRDGFYIQEEDVDQEDLSKNQIPTFFPPPYSSSSSSSSSTTTSASSSCSVVPLTWSGVEKEHMFDKVVTPSDVGKLNRLVIPKQYAEKYFPLDSSSNEKGLLLNFEDRNSKPWCFRYSYWNSSQSYVMTKGWSRFVKEKQLDAGDTVSFARAGADRLFIDWKRRPYVHDPPRFPRLPLPSISFARAAASWGGRLFIPPMPPPHPPAATLYEHHQRRQAYDYNAVVPQFPVPVVLDSMPVADSPAAAKRVRLFGVDLNRPMLQLPPVESSAASPSSSSEKDQRSLDLDM